MYFYLMFIHKISAHYYSLVYNNLRGYVNFKQYLSTQQAELVEPEAGVSEISWTSWSPWLNGLVLAKGKAMAAAGMKCWLLSYLFTV